MGCIDQSDVGLPFVATRMPTEDAAPAKAPSNAARPSQGRRRMMCGFHGIREIHAPTELYSKTVGRDCFERERFERDCFERDCFD